ncbi:MAG: Nif3-like dinuclear metal center hexameric protein [Selenomonadaceae bacterium]|nr:Nif3-like dinuclear metal center hexameric protein [Selenomonadaceae bacterium]
MKKCTVQAVADAINRLAPRKLAEEWDNPGLLIGNPSAEVKKVFVCLDVLENQISQAIELDAQLIVAHHPLIFHAIKNIRYDLPLGNKISRLIKNNLAVFAAHTNLDSAEGGVNDVLAKKIGLNDIKMLGDEEISSMGRLGTLETPMTALEFAQHVKKCLNADNVRLVDAGDFIIKKIGVCGGAGADFIQKAKFFGAQAFVTGDVKYHEAQNALENKIHVVDAGHFYTEFPIVHELAEFLRGELENFAVEIFEDKNGKNFFRTI